VARPGGSKREPRQFDFRDSWLIVAVNDTHVANVNGLRLALRENLPNEGMRLQLKRDGATRFVFIKSL
jgi:S1-C subfamily serine protease